MLTRINRSVMPARCLLLTICFLVTARAHAFTPKPTRLCPGTQLTDIQTVFPPCSNIASSVTFVVTSTNPVISYSLNGGISTQSSPVFTNLPAGNYTLTLLVAPDCIVSFPVSISNPGAPFFAEFEQRDVSCSGNNGIIAFEVAGGTAPYSYFITYGNGSTFPLFSDSTGGFFPGTYQITAEDANGCSIDTTVTLLSYQFPSIGSVVTTPATCGNANGSITVVIANPPVGNYTVSYSINGGFTYQSSNVFNNLGPGVYPVYAAVNSCLSNGGQPIFVTIGEDAGIDLQGVTVNPSACTASDGSITINASAAGNPLVYSLNGGAFQTGNTFTNLGPGNYTISVQNTANGCETDTLITLGTANVGTITAVQLIPGTCLDNNGQLTVTASSPGGNLLYSINGGLTFGTNNTFGNLAGGVYTVVIQNSSNGCSIDTVVTLNTTNAPVINALQITNADCSGNLGQVIVQATAFIPGQLLYSLNGGITTQTSPVFANLAVGNYTVQVTDASGCTTSGSFTITNPAVPFFAAFSVENISCIGNDGVIEFEVQGGLSPYSYSIDYNGSGTFPLSTDSIGGFTPGTYQLVVEDATGCAIDTTVTLIAYGFPMIQEVLTTEPDCNTNNGSLQIILSNPPPASYTTGYSINGGLTYQPSNLFTGLAPGQYTIYVSVEGCLSGMGIPLFVTLEENTTIVGADVAVGPSDCNTSNGSITISVNNPANSLQYSIDGGLTYTDNPVFTGLTAAEYAVSIQNTVDGCQLDTLVVIEFVPGPEITGIAVTLADCGINNGELLVTAADPNNQELVYTISPGGIDQPDGNFTGLGPGSYTITVSNPASGCASSISGSIPDNSIPVVNAGPDQQVCAGNSVTLNATGTPGATLTWSNGVGNGFSFEPNFSTPLTATATLINGCSASDELLITVFEPQVPQFTVAAISNCFPVTATVELLNTGFSNCNWSVSNGFTSDVCGDIALVFSEGGCYDLTLNTTDGNGCLATVSQQDAICLDPGPQANFTITPGSITTDETTIAFTNTSEHAESYSWQLFNGLASQAVNPVYNGQLLPGFYTIQLIAFDELGCADTAVRLVEVTTVFSVFIPNAFTPDGNEFNQQFMPVLSPGYDATDYRFLIYNRWGEVVFESLNPEIGWDGTYAGKLVPQGMYTYQLITRLLGNAEVVTYTGHVSVLR